MEMQTQGEKVDNNGVRKKQHRQPKSLSSGSIQSQLGIIFLERYWHHLAYMAPDKNKNMNNILGFV